MRWWGCAFSDVNHPDMAASSIYTYSPSLPAPWWCPALLLFLPGDLLLFQFCSLVMSFFFSFARWWCQLPQDGSCVPGDSGITLLVRASRAQSLGPRQWPPISTVGAPVFLLFNRIHGWLIVSSFSWWSLVFIGRKWRLRTWNHHRISSTSSSPFWRSGRRHHCLLSSSSQRWRKGIITYHYNHPRIDNHHHNSHHWHHHHHHLDDRGEASLHILEKVWALCKLLVPHSSKLCVIGKTYLSASSSSS